MNIFSVLIAVVLGVIILTAAYVLIAWGVYGPSTLELRYRVPLEKGARGLLRGDVVVVTSVSKPRPNGECMVFYWKTGIKFCMSNRRWAREVEPLPPGYSPLRVINGGRR